MVNEATFLASDDQAALEAKLKEFQKAIPIYNDQEVLDMERLLTRQTVKAKVQENQTVMEFNQHGELVEPIPQSLTRIEIELPMNIYELEIEKSLPAELELTTEDIEDFGDAVFEADRSLRMKEILRSCLVRETDASKAGWWKDVANPNQTPPPYRANISWTGHNHYDWSGSVTLPVIESMALDIIHHGFSRQNLWLYINSADLSILTNLATWADPIKGELQVSGQAGTVAGIKVVSNDWMPVNYLFMVDSMKQPLRKRVNTNAAKQGLMQRLTADTSLYALLRDAWIRQMGYRVTFRGSGTVTEITANAFYTDPII